MLVDCGLGPRITATRLGDTGVSVKDIRSICLTHLDHDHFNSAWASTILKLGIRVFVAADRVHEVMGAFNDEQLRERVVGFRSDVFEPLPGLRAHALRMAHDRTGSHAFRFESEQGSIGYATDLGNVPAGLIEHFCGVDLLAIESNYDPQMQRTSGRPWFLQQRIMGGGGHLSNKEALAAVKAILEKCAQSRRRAPKQVVLLHRSRQCNCPNLLRELFATDRRLAAKVVLAEQYSRTAWMSTQTVGEVWVGEQLSFGFA